MFSKVQSWNYRYHNDLGGMSTEGEKKDTMSHLNLFKMVQGNGHFWIKLPWDAYENFRIIDPAGLVLYHSKLRLVFQSLFFTMPELPSICGSFLMRHISGHRCQTDRLILFRLTPVFFPSGTILTFFFSSDQGSASYGLDMRLILDNPNPHKAYVFKKKKKKKWSRPHVAQSLKRLLSGPLQEKLANHFVAYN